MTDVVVLGWDGLDAELIERFDLADAFGQHRAKIDTYINPAIEEPHTLELWPSMIIGLPPEDHGVVAATKADGIEWENPLLNLGATVGNTVLPDDLLTYLGARLREQGFGPSIKSSDYYEAHGVATVFDDVGGRAISIPNYQTDRDREHELDAHRDELWQALEAEHKGGWKPPGVSVTRSYGLLGAEVGRRVGHTLDAVEADEPLVWTWFGLLDSIGHMKPALGDSVVDLWYQVAASITARVRALTPPETTVIAVSDHGIQDGSHTHYATICSDEAAPVGAVDHVFDLAGWLRAQEYGGAGDVRQLDEAGRAEVREELEALGYV